MTTQRLRRFENLINESKNDLECKSIRTYPNEIAGTECISSEETEKHHETTRSSYEAAGKFIQYHEYRKMKTWIFPLFKHHQNPGSTNQWVSLWTRSESNFINCFWKCEDIFRSDIVHIPDIGKVSLLLRGGSINPRTILDVTFRRICLNPVWIV